MTLIFSRYIGWADFHFFFWGGGSKFLISIFLEVFRNIDYIFGHRDFCGYVSVVGGGGGGMGSFLNWTIFMGYF